MLPNNIFQAVHNQTREYSALWYLNLKGNCHSLTITVYVLHVRVLDGERNVLVGREDEVLRVLAPLLGGGQFRVVGVRSVKVLSPQDLLLVQARHELVHNRLSYRIGSGRRKKRGWKGMGRETKRGRLI